MFEVAWAPIMGVLSQTLENFDDPQMVDQCLIGFKYSIRLACRLDFPVGRNTFINALANFTALDTLREMRPKNVETIKVLIDLALSEGDYLEESWSQVLQCVSQLARLQLFANGLRTDDMFFSDSFSDVRGGQNGNRKSIAMSGKSDPFTKLFSGPTRAETARQVEEANAEMVMRDINTLVIDRIFINSESLSDESVQHFVRSLCGVGLLEISSSRSMNSLRGKETPGDTATPRVFCLQKLVEVADFNMHSRSRIAWTSIWSLLANHFTAVGIYDNHPLAMYAIDSLKQLSIKFLQKEELSNFNFQRMFLKPFEVIIARSRSPEIKDLILRCIDIMILACASNIRSGWRTIFTIFEASAVQDVPEIANISFEIIERLMTNQFDLLIFDFVELMNCLVAFVAGAHTNLSLRALNHLARCADHLAEGAVAPALDAQHNSSDQFGISFEKSNVSVTSIQIGEDASVFRLWWPLLLGLSTRVADGRLQVRVRALDTLHLVLRNYGHLFSPQAWAVIFRGVLFPIVDSAKTDSVSGGGSLWPTENPLLTTENHSWIGTMGLKVLTVCLELYQQFQDKGESVPLLPDLMTMLESCICQDTESLAKMGLHTYSNLVLSLGETIGAGYGEDGDDEENKSVLLSIGIELGTADLLCFRLCACLRRNLCLDFGMVGNLTFSRDSPPEIIGCFSECPLASRRRAKEGGSTPEDRSMNSLGSLVLTPFGEGSIIQVSKFSILNFILFILPPLLHSLLLHLRLFLRMQDSDCRIVGVSSFLGAFFIPKRLTHTSRAPTSTKEATPIHRGQTRYSSGGH